MLLEVAITDGSSFYDDDAPLPAGLHQALEVVNALFAPGRLTVRPVRVRRIAAEDPLAIFRGDHAAIERMHRALHTCDPDGVAPDDRFIPLWLAGCLRLSDPVLGETSQPEGFVPRIPDGFPAAGRAHGVFIKGRDCDAGSAPIEWPAAYLGRLIAHELGHYLGLYHTVEADGTADALDDTGPENLMHYRPLQGADAGFSASQLRVMRRHPAVRWE
jgi:hypothetical protein